jgi:hypothetical protein
MLIGHHNVSAVSTLQDIFTWSNIVSKLEDSRGKNRISNWAFRILQKIWKV